MYKDGSISNINNDNLTIYILTMSFSGKSWNYNHTYGNIMIYKEISRVNHCL